MKDKRENTFNSFDQLQDLRELMIANGANVLDSDLENNGVNNEDPNREGVSFEPDSNEAKSEIESMVLEEELIEEINQAEEVLNEVSGIPKAENAEGEIVEAEKSITDVSHVEWEDSGVVSDIDKEERLSDAETIAEEIKKCDGLMESAIATDPYLLPLYKAEVIREKLSQETKNIIRETAPELFAMINPRDVELMILLDEKFKLAKIDKKPLKEKFALAKRKGIVSEEVLAEYNKALNSKKVFMEKAKELQVPADVAKIIFKADPIFIKEIRDGEEYVSTVQNEEVEEGVVENEIVSDASNIPLEDVIQEEAIPEGGLLESEMEAIEEKEIISQKEEFKNKSEFFKQFVEKIIDESEKERLFNALNTFDQMIEKISDSDDKDNEDQIFNTGDYMLGLEENIKAALNEKQLKIEESEAAVEIVSEVEKIENNFETGKEFVLMSYDDWASSLPKELEISAKMAFNPNKSQTFKDIKFYTDENEIHYVVYIEQNGEKQARKMYVREDDFAPTAVTELVDPLILEGSNEETEKVNEEIEAPVQEEKVEGVVEVKEVEKTILLKKMDTVRVAIDRCREIAHSVNNEDKKEQTLALIKTLHSTTFMIFNDANLDDESKILHIDNAVRKTVSEIDSIYNLSKENSEPEDVVEGKKVIVEDSNIRPSREIPSNILEKYEKYGIGLDALKEIKGFNDLTDGQKLLVLKNYESAILSKTHIDSKEESNQEWNNQPVLGRLGLSVITLGMAKTFREKRKQQELANKIIRGDYLGFENRQAMLESLTQVAKESPDVYLNKEGELQVCYVNENKFRDNAYAHDILADYNVAATEYAKIPFSWFDSANTYNSDDEKVSSYYKKLSAVKGSSLEGKEKARFSDARDNFEKAREKYFNLIIEEIGDSPENRRYALRELNSLDERVRMNQMFNSDPNAEKALQNIQDVNVFNQTLSEFWSKKGKYMAYGALTRAMAAATVASIAAPIGLIVVRHSSLLRSKREVRDMMKFRRTTGTLTDQDLREDVVYNVDLEKSQEDLKALLAKANDEGDVKGAYHLNSRLNEVNDKLKSGYKFERRTRKLGEFRDAKFFSDRVEQLVSRYELLKSVKGQEEESEAIERKIAQTATLMRELMNNGMLTFGKGESVKGDSASMINRLKFIQALALADTTISIDDEKIKEKMSRIVDLRREKIDKMDADRASKHISRQIKYSVAFGAAGYAIGHLASEFFGAPHFEGAHDGMIRIEKGDNINEIINHNIKGLDHLSNNARENVISNFLNRLRPDQLKEIGIANPHSLKAGETINLEAMQKYFDNTRVNGRTLVENARIITGEKALGGQLTQFINNVIDDYYSNQAGPDDEVVSHVVNAKHTSSGFVPANEHVTSAPSEVNENAVDATSVKEAPAPHSEPEAYVDGSEKSMQEDWQDYTIPEKIQIADKLTPEYLEKQLGRENMSVFNESAKNMSSSSLLLTDYSAGGGKAKMLEELHQILEEKGITPENGFEYKYNETLYEYVTKAYKYKIISEGINSVK